jgi:hypothetical protein
MPSPRTTLENPISPTCQKCQVAQQWQVSLELVTKEQFLKERKTTCLTTSPLPTC